MLSRARGATLSCVLVVAASLAQAQARVEVLRDAVASSASRMVARADGSIVVLGSSGAANPQWLVELSPAGDIVRQVTLVGPTANPRFYALGDSGDGGVILAGNLATSTGSNPLDAVVMKLDASWNVAWQTCHGVPTGNEVPYGIKPVSDGGWLVHGNAAGGALLLRLDAGGAALWQRRYSAPGWVVSFTPLAPLGPDRWLLVSRAQGASSVDDELLIAEIDAGGGVASPRLVGTPNQDLAQDIHVLADGSAWIAGALNSSDGATRHAAVIKLAPNGSLLLSRGFYLDGGRIDVTAALPGPGGGFIVGGTVATATEQENVVFFGIDAAGDPSWFSVFGGRQTDRVGDFDLVLGSPVLVGSTGSIDGAAAPVRAAVMTLDAAWQPPEACGLARSDMLRSVDLVTVAGAIDVTGSDAAGAVTVNAPVTLVPSLLSSFIACSAAPLPPREVSPPGAVTPLLVTGEGTLTWEDGALSGSDEFDVQRGLVSDLRALGYGSCWQTMLPVTTVADAELPGEGESWFYLVGGRNAAGIGTLGWDSRGTERLLASRCP